MPVRVARPIPPYLDHPKYCVHCRKTKEAVSFGLRPEGRGLRAWCQDCRNGDRAAWRANHVYERNETLDGRRSAGPRKSQFAREEQERKDYERTVTRRCLETICETLEITADEVKSNARPLHLVEARRVYAYIVVVVLGCGTTEAARTVERDHSTIVHHTQTMTRQPWDYETRWLVEEVSRRLNVPALQQRRA